MESSVCMYLHGAKLLMTIDLSPHNTRNTSSDQYRIELFDTENKKFVFSGNLQETIELILLGKLHKESGAIPAEQIRELQDNG